MTFAKKEPLYTKFFLPILFLFPYHPYQPILHFLITPGWFVTVWPFLSLGWFSLWRDRRQIRERGRERGREVDCQEVLALPLHQDSSGGGKEGWHRSTLRWFKHCRKSNPPDFRKNFLYDRVLADIQTYMEMHDVTDCRRDKGPRLEEGNR